MNEAAATDTLRAMIDRTSFAIDLIGPPDNTGFVFARCWMLNTRFAEHGGPLSDLTRALDDFEALPGDFPGLPKLAATLVITQMRRSVLRETPEIERAARFAVIADRDPTPMADWPPASAAMRALDLATAAQKGRPGFDIRGALDEVMGLAARVGDDQPYATMIELSRIALAHHVAVADSNVSEQVEIMDAFDRVARQLGQGPSAEPMAEVIRAILRVHEAAMRGEVDGIAAGLARLTEQVHQLPPGNQFRQSIEDMLGSTAPFVAMMAPGGAADPAMQGQGFGPVNPAMMAQLVQLRSMAERPGMSSEERAMRLGLLGSAELSVADTSESMLTTAIGHLAEAAAVSPEHDPRRPFHLMTLGIAHLRRQEETGRRDDLAAGIRYLEESRDAAKTSANTYWTLASMPLAHAYRRDGRSAKGREVAFSGLRGHAWGVLLQHSAVDAADSARNAADDALDVARWCLADNDPAAAALALDAGRGLTLYAAMRRGDVEAQLRRAGEDRLADQWRQAQTVVGPSGLPSSLRREVLARLAGVPVDSDGSVAAPPPASPTRFLDPPSLDEVRAALRALDMDALVYLVPGDDKSGAAVIVSATEMPSWVMLPELNRKYGVEMSDWLTRTTRGRTGTPPSAGPDLGARREIGPIREGSHGVIDRVCEWAWRAAMGPILDTHLSLPTDRPPRLVLIPMRELSRVPWHAAHRTVGGRRVYAIEQAMFSYAASGRLLCDAAWRSVEAATGRGLIVGDPDTAGEAADLVAARGEALAIREAFYPNAVYLGREVDGSPSPAGVGEATEVLGWLSGSAAGDFVHLACHGVIRSGGGPGETSHLLLAGGQRLAAEQLIDSLSSGAGSPLALAVLAACNTDVATRGGYDEAFSLATSFLASGARTVISAQWSIPDVPTSALMFMFHHYLGEGEPPMVALWRAQQWMISTDRFDVESMPHALRRNLPEPGRIDIASWAAFVHSGR